MFVEAIFLKKNEGSRFPIRNYSVLRTSLNDVSLMINRTFNYLPR